ncbi:MAG: polyphenol oxidase family protein [Actinomycetes bacterium]
MWTGVIPADVQMPIQAGWWAQYAFTDRLGGVSAGEFSSWNVGVHVGDEPASVHRNRELLAERIAQVGVAQPAPKLAVLQGVHGADVIVVDSNATQSNSGADGIVTTSTGLAVVATAADCVPMVLADVTAGVVGAAHCGWVGLTVGIVDAVVDQMLALGAKPRNMVAVVGPAICGQCYGVPDERAEQVRQFVPTAVVQARNGGPGIDGRIGVLAQLSARRVSATTVGGCTFEDLDLYSYRRDGSTGRLGAAIVLRYAQ